MKLAIKKSMAMMTGAALLAGVGMVHADGTETGQVNLTTPATGLFENDGVIVRMNTPSPTASGLCNNGGDMVMLLNGEASKATYSALLAAVTSGKSVTVTFAQDEEAGGECLLATAKIQ